MRHAGHVAFTNTDEQRALRATVADLMAKRSSEHQVRELMATDTGYDPVVWQELGDMGLPGLLIPEEMGGSGAGPVELGIVMEEMGGALLCAPYLSTAVLAPNLLSTVDDTAERMNTLPRIAAGELIVGVAFAEGTSAWLPDSIATSARAAGDGWRLTGEKTFVLDALSADLLYVLAQTDSGPTIFAADRETPGLEAEPLTTVDLTRKLGRVRFADTPARLIGAPGDGVAAMTAALDESAVALVSEQAGGAHRAMEMAAEYAKTRYQFGRAIGSFQAVKHMCADMLLEAESAPLGGTTRGMGVRGRIALAMGRSRAGAGVLLGCVRDGRRNQHPGARRNRVHLGASRPPVPAACPVRRPAAGPPVGAP
jgi:alkylation response protein AidB-like acyl-CoA dehydrogenase